MSFTGSSPTLKRTRYTPQAADPVNPIDGDFFFSNGIPRAEGPWVYFNSAWQQVSVSGALTTVNDLTFTPQAADPGSPTEGMVFYANGTSRTEGLWIYFTGGWFQLTGVRYQEFKLQTYFEVRAASTTNVTLASQVENGDSFGGVTLATGNLVLLKNQTTTTENGVYTVNASGAPTRSTSYDTAAELTRASIFVTSGTNANTKWFQNNTLTTLADPQSWAAAPTSFSFTVPDNVTVMRAILCGGGAGGGRGGVRVTAGSGPQGGGGGGGSVPVEVTFNTTPGDVLDIDVGVGGLGGAASTSSGSANGLPGNDGTDSMVSGTGINLICAGGLAGIGGSTSSLVDNAGTPATWDAAGSSSTGGGGGHGANDGLGGTGLSGGATSWYSVASTGGAGAVAGTGTPSGGGGGGGGAGLGAGANGGTGGRAAILETRGGDAAGGTGGGGGGGGGFGKTTGTNDSIERGGHGGSGCVRLYWN